MTVPGGFVAGTALPASDMNLLPGGLEPGLLAERTTTQSGISAIADLTGLTVTWTAVSGRSYLISSLVLMLQATSAGVAEVRLTNAANTVFQVSAFNQGIGEYATHTPSRVVSGLSGSQTFKLRALTSAGTVGTQVAATSPAYLLVTDIGPT